MALKVCITFSRRKLDYFSETVDTGHFGVVSEERFGARDKSIALFVTGRSAVRRYFPTPNATLNAISRKPRKDKFSHATPYAYTNILNELCDSLE